MYELATESPEDKLQKYAEVNGIDMPTGYVNFVPNQQVNNTLSFIQPPKQTIDLGSLIDNKKAQAPVILKKAPTEKMDTPPLDLPTDPAAVINQPQFVENSPMKVLPSKAAKEAYNYYLKQYGIPSHIAAGIVGNLYQESGLDPLRKENNNGNGRGIAQWDVRDRFPAMQKWAKMHGKDPDSLYTQLDYILAEPGEQSAIKKTLASKDVTEATHTFGKFYERPNDAAANWARRQGIALKLMSS